MNRFPAVIILTICELIAGILLLIQPVRFTTIIISGFGILMLISGILNIISYFRKDSVAAAKEQLLAKGLAAALFGAFCTFRSDWFIAAFPILTFIYGIGILFSGLMKIQSTVDALRLKQSSWYWHAAGALSSLVLAGIIMLNPFSSAAYLWIFTGVSLIVEALIDFITLVIARKTSRA